MRPRTGPLLPALALVMLCTAGCSSLPTFVPDLSRHGAPPPTLVGAHGPLSAAQSQAVLAKLQLTSPGTDIFKPRARPGPGTTATTESC